MLTGGMWVGPSHTALLELLTELGLELYPSTHTLGATFLSWEGVLHNFTGACWDCLIMPGSGDVERMEGIHAAMHAAPAALQPALAEVAALMSQLKDIARSVNVARPWETPNAAELDAMTFKQWVYARTETQLARRIMELAVRMQGATNSEPEWTSVLHVARQLAAAPQPQRPESYLIKGAAGQVPELLAAQVEASGGRIVLSSPVRAIQDNDIEGLGQGIDSGVDDVMLGNAASSTEHTAKDGPLLVQSDMLTVHARRVIVATPPHLAGRIQYDPPMPPIRDQLTQRMPMGSIIKCIAVYNKPFWTEHALRAELQRRNDAGGHGAFNASALWMHRLAPGYVLNPGGEAGSAGVALAYDISPPAAVGGGGAGVLATFLTAHATPDASMDLSTPEARQAHVLESFVRWFGPEAAHPVEFLEKVWPAEPWTGGAFTSIMPPGGWTGFGAALEEPVGRIHWAGTETSTAWPGYYEGAVQAGLRAAREVAEALQQNADI